MRISDKLPEVIGMYEKNMEDKRLGRATSIPFGFPRFDERFPGIVPGRYYCVTAGSGVSKTKVTKQLFVQTPLLYTLRNPNVKVKILWFAAEESHDTWLTSILSNLVYRATAKTYREYVQTKGTTVGAPMPVLLDTDTFFSYGNKTLTEDHLQLIRKLSPMAKQLLDNVYVYDDVTRPSSIYMKVRDFAAQNGTFYYKGQPVEVPKTEGASWQSVHWDEYKAHDPYQYVIVVMDHVSIIEPEKRHKTLGEAMSEMSAKYFNQLIANKFKYVPVAVHQQMAAQEDIEHIKRKKILPSLQGLGDNKLLGRDYQVVLGVTAFERHSDIADWGDYEVQRMKGSCRLLSVEKNRWGPTNFSTMLAFYGEVDYFSELPPATSMDERVYDAVKNRLYF